MRDGELYPYSLFPELALSFVQVSWAGTHIERAPTQTMVAVRKWSVCGVGMGVMGQGAESKQEGSP